MSTRKLKYFEYAGQSAQVRDGGVSQHIFDSFESPNGFVFLIAGNSLPGESGESLSRTAIQRVRYYLDNEVPENPTDAVRNALMYANGFMHVMAQSDEGIRDAELSCMCVIVNDRRVYYAWAGQVCFYLYTGRKLVQLNWDVYRDPELSGPSRPWELAFLGQDRVLNPGVCRQELMPATNDRILFGSGGLCLESDQKFLKKMLSDTMPAHIRVARLLAKPEEDDISAACMLVQFYNMGQDERSFVVADDVDPRPRRALHRFAGTLNFEQFPWVKAVLLLLAALLLAYMLYDMFFFNPRGTATVRDTLADHALVTGTADTIPGNDSQDVSGQAPPQSAGEEVRAAPAPAPQTAAPAIPDDIVYLVRRGDTWGRIYREFEVCSWFIRNQSQNQGKFDGANNPVAGSQIYIPVVYSAKRSLNPHFYDAFTVDKVGSSCQHASQAFIERFEQTLLRPQH